MTSLVSVINLSLLLHDTGFPNFTHSSFWSVSVVLFDLFNHLANQSSCKPKKTPKGFLSLYLQLSDKSTKYDFVNSPVPQDNKNYIQGSLKMRKTYIIWYENIKSDCLFWDWFKITPQIHCSQLKKDLLVGCGSHFTWDERTWLH